MNAAEQLIKDTLDSFSNEEIQKINDEAADLFEGSVANTSTDMDLTPLIDTWRDTVKVLTRFISAAANAIVVKNDSNYENSEEYVELKNMLTQYRFFGKLLSLAQNKPSDKPEVVNKITLDKLPGESDQEHLERLKKYLDGRTADKAT